MIYPARIEARRVPGASKKQKIKCVNDIFSSSCVRGLLFSAFCFLFSALPLAALDYTIAWDWPTNQTTAAAMQLNPWLKIGPERVDIALSFNGATAYTAIASGVPSTYGTNTYAISLPDDPAWLSTNAVLRVQTRLRYAQPQTSVTVQHQISGLHMVSPPASVTNDTEVTLRWVAAGAGPLVQLGYQVTGAISWQPLAVFGNADSTQGATTNTATWYVSGLQPGPGRIVLQSMSDANISRITNIEVSP